MVSSCIENKNSFFYHGRDKYKANLLVVPSDLVVVSRERRLLAHHVLSVLPSLHHRRETTRRKLKEDAAKIELLRSEKERLKATRGQLSSET